MAMKNIPLGQRPRFNSARQFSNQIGIWQRDNLLFEKAIKLKLDENVQVLKEIYSFKAEQSYYYYLNSLLDNLNPPSFVIDYFQLSEEDRFRTSYHPLSGFQNLEAWKWWRAQQDLHQLLRNQNPTIWINPKLLEKENNRIEWGNQIRMFMFRKPS
jgi:hypothetical protein